MQTAPSTENLVQEEDNRAGNSCNALNGGAHGNFQIKNEDGGGVCTSAWQTVETLQATLLMLYESECEPVRRINSELWGSLCFNVCLENCVLLFWWHGFLLINRAMLAVFSPS